MGALLALVGWPEAEAPPEAWTGSTAGGVPIVLGDVRGPGPAVARATSADGLISAVFAGALSNRRELEDVLGLAAAAHAPRDDAAIMLRLYEGRGDNAVGALRGGFALALWDGRRQRLLLARDQLGLRPLYYLAERSRCAAASALAPLAVLPGVAGGPDLSMVDLVFAFGAVPAPATLYPGIRQLRPGELLVWESGRHRAHRYWQLRFPEARSARQVVSRDAARRAREQLDEAVRQRTAGVVTGLLLSGGLGAGTLLALASGLGREPACAITMAGNDEADARRARALAQRAHLAHDVLHPDVDWERAVDVMLATQGGPDGAVESVLLGPAVGALASQARVLMAGAGVEEVLGGGPAERAWLACERYRALPGLVREALDIVGASGRPRRLAWTTQAAGSAPLDVYADVVSLAGAARRYALYGPELRAATARAPAARALVPIVSEAVSAGATDAGDTLYYVRLVLGVPRIGAMFDAATPMGVDVRLPFVDPRVAQIAAAIPPRVRASLRRRTPLLLGAIGDALVREVRRAVHIPLAPTPPPGRRGALAAFAGEVLASERVARLGLFDPAAVARLRAEHDAGLDDGGVLWRLMLVSRWLEQPDLAVGYSSAPAATSAVMRSSS